MPGQFLAPPRRAVRYLILAAAALAVMTVAGLCIETAVIPKAPAPTGVPAAAPGPGEATGIGKNGALSPGPQPPLQLAAGTRYADGVSTGYPDTLTGAVSAGVEYASALGSNLDSSIAASVMQQVADPSFRGAAAQAAQGAQDDRRQMGLPAAGPVPAGASLSFSVSEYQIRTPAPGQVTVLLLGDTTQTTAADGTKVYLAVVPVPLHWDGQDWKLTAADPTADYSGPAVSPGTAGAAGLGWQPIAF